ncbi:hypothetical protein N8616_00550 [Verrucomicrobia bacterium]|nr:hypothetical protein [Verrucomicrobiota bacterium]MDA7532830.1 hypothetical protein [Verrucomicrobiota bacterium]MDB4350789.1 hypothetical protein [Verrucomicrobiota bacterium]MDB4705036.1 hypothetical protein [Verrucomicrobiota bacterium]MDB4777065.1 hypothetical protein [Verrucomicrobiota bacterium]
MQSHELLRDLFKEGSPKQIAEDMGLSLSMIYKWAEPKGEKGSGTHNPLDRFKDLLDSTQDKRLLEWVCEKGGGFFIHNPKNTHAHPDFLIPATNTIVQEFADLLSVVASAAGDNHITPPEAVRIRQRWEQLKSVTEGFVHCCEEGNFTNLQIEAEKAVTKKVS